MGVSFVEELYCKHHRSFASTYAATREAGAEKSCHPKNIELSVARKTKRHIWKSYVNLHTTKVSLETILHPFRCLRGSGPRVYATRLLPRAGGAQSVHLSPYLDTDLSFCETLRLCFRSLIRAHPASVAPFDSSRLISSSMCANKLLLIFCWAERSTSSPPSFSSASSQFQKLFIIGVMMSTWEGK